MGDPPPPPPPPPLPEWVYIKEGKHKGKTLRFVKYTDKRIGVTDENVSKEKIIYLLPDHVEIKSGHLPHPNRNNNNDDEKEEEEALYRNSKRPEAAKPPTNDIVAHKLPSFTPWVRITKGKQKGNIVRFVKRTTQRVAVERGDDGKIIYLLPDYIENILETEENTIQNNIEFQQKNQSNSYNCRARNECSILIDRLEEPVLVTDDDQEEENEDMEEEEEDLFDFMTAAEDISTENEGVDYDNIDTTSLCNEECNSLKKGDNITIYGGTHAGKNAIFEKYTSKRVAVRIDGTPNITYLSPNSLVNRSRSSTFNIVVENDMNDPMCQAIRCQLSTTHTKSVLIQNVTDFVLNRTLFGTIFKVDKPVFFNMSTTSLSMLPHEFVKDDQTFHLVCVKLHDKAKYLTCSYILAKSKRYIENRLLQIGAFDQLVPCKICARLELLLSTSSKDENIHELQKSNFCTIPEKGNTGCGFIPRHMIDQLMGKPSPDVCAIQVRIVIPSLGIFKGMLMEKSGIDKIELPPSMLKVHATRDHMYYENKAWLLINQSGVHPYPKRKKQADESFQSKKIISTQAQWMLVQKGVSRTYLKEPNSNHSSLVGVADPTDSIPSKCVFISGIRNYSDKFGNKVLISRFPMTEASDGRILSIIQEKPERMSVADWELLCSKPFGFIIFGNPAPGDKPMPEQISQGDLDGDDYFVTWDNTIIQDAIIGDQPKFPKKNPPGSPPVDWWTDSLEYMSNIHQRMQSQKLIGCLHDLWLKKLQKNLQSDAIIYGQAYKDSLVASKHGGKIVLPSELISHIPMHLRDSIKRL